MAGPVDPRLWRRARATRSYLIAGIAVGTVTAVAVVAQAWLLARLVSTAFHRTGLPVGLGEVPPMPDYPFGTVAAALGVLALVIAVRAALAWFNSWLAHRAAARVKSQLRADIMAARLAAPTDSTLSTGQLIQVVTRGLDHLDGYFGRYLPQLALAITVPAIVGTAILLTDWESTLVVALTLPLIPLFMVLIGLATRAQMDKSWRTQSRLANHFSDLVAGLPTLQSFGRAAAQRTGLEANERRHRRQTMATLRVTFLSGGVLELLATYSVALVAVPIGLQLAFGRMDLLTGLFVLILVPEVYLPVRQVGVHYHDSVDGIAAAEEAFAVIDAAAQVTPTPPAGPAGPGTGTAPGAGTTAGAGAGTAVPDLAASVDPGLHLSEVTVRHGERTVLDHFTLDVAPGEVVALTGPSGCGKSTALAALMGFREPDAGSIMVRGQFDAGPRTTAAERRDLLAWVGQEPRLLRGTVAENVRLGDTEASAAQVRSALERAATTLAPDHQVLDRDTGLSAGERRRVALARALLRVDAGAEWLILDEPTAGLDTDSEARVIATLRASGIGALVVTHRPAVIAAANRVVELSPVPDPTTAAPAEV